MSELRFCNASLLLAEGMKNTKFEFSRALTWFCCVNKSALTLDGVSRKLQLNPYFYEKMHNNAFCV